MSNYINISLQNFKKKILIKYKNIKIKKEYNKITKDFDKLKKEVFQKILPQLKIKNLKTLILKENEGIDINIIEKFLKEDKVKSKLTALDINRTFFLLKPNEIKNHFKLNEKELERDNYIYNILKIKKDENNTNVVLNHFKIKDNDTYITLLKINKELNFFLKDLIFKTNKEEIFKNILPKINIEDFKILIKGENDIVDEKDIELILKKNKIKTDLSPYEIAENIYYQKPNEIKTYFLKNQTNLKKITKTEISAIKNDTRNNKIGFKQHLKKETKSNKPKKNKIKI